MPEEKMVTKAEYVRQLISLSVLSDCEKLALISPTVRFHYDINTTYYKLRNQGFKKMDAYHTAALEHQVSVKTVIRVIEDMAQSHPIID